MNLYFPSLTSLVRGIILALILTVIGHYAVQAIEISTLSTSLFTYGIAAGTLAMLLLSSLFIDTKVRTTTLYVGNLAFKTNEAALRELFSEYGQVQSVRIMKDRLTRKPRGFAFVEMERSGARAAARSLNGEEFNERVIKVNVANRRKSNDN
ncbi:MAG: RNA-binding protein [Gammaproteobacteria bacterium]|nr:RNA-binding protein [Gammaproteobacteria bacterium]